MSNRLPTPGADNGDWGDILNAYLEVSHAADGTLNPNVVGTSQIQSGAVTNLQLDTPTQMAIAKANAALPSSGGTVSGKLIVSKLQITGGSPSANLVLTSDASGNASWAISPAAPVTSVAGRTGAITISESDVANLTTDLAAKYVKPDNGIPGSDIANATITTGQLANNSVTNANLDNPTQTAISKASSAVQSVNGHTGNTIELTSSDVGALEATNNLSDVSDAGTSRQNLQIPSLQPAACLAASNVASLSGLNSYDGYTLNAGDQVLLIAQSVASQNGPWVAASGSWTRPADFSTGSSVQARTIQIIQGTNYAGSTYLLKTNGPITVDTASQTWVSQLPSSVVNVSTEPPDAGYVLVSTGSSSNNGEWIVSTAVDLTDAPEALALSANPGTGLSGVSASDHVHPMPTTTQLADVSGTPSNGQAMVWNSTLGKFEPATIVSNAPLWLSASNGQITLPRGHLDDSGSYSATPVSQQLHLSYFLASAAQSVGHIKFGTGGTAASGNSLTQVGLFSVNASTGALTLVANSSSPGSALGTYAQVSLALTSSYSLVAGSTYAVGILQVGTTSASLLGAWSNNEYLSITPIICASSSGHSLMPSSLSSVSSSNFIVSYFLGS